MLRRNSALLLVLVSTQGCVVGPDFVEPAPVLAEGFVEATPDAFTPAPVTTELWRSFEENELDALIGRALEHNNTIAQALATLNETRALSGLSLYSWFPTVGISVDGERNRSSPSDPFSFPGMEKTDRYRAGFDMLWEIDLFGSLRRQTEAIRRRTEADFATLQAVQLSIVAEVAQTYFALRGSQDRKSVV